MIGHRGLETLTDPVDVEVIVASLIPLVGFRYTFADTSGPS